MTEMFLMLISVVQLMADLFFLEYFINVRIKDKIRFPLAVMMYLPVMMLSVLQSESLVMLLNVLILVCLSRWILSNFWISSFLAGIIAVGTRQLAFGLGNTVTILITPMVFQQIGNGNSGIFLMIFSCLCSLLLTGGCYLILVKKFSIQQMPAGKYAAIMLVPLLLVLLLAQYVLENIFGNAVAVDRLGHVYFPEGTGGDYTQLLFIQILAMGSVFSVLYSCHKIAKYFSTKIKLTMLQQEAHLQKEYIEELKFHYEHTRAFRHDVKNHLVVLSGLLQTDKVDEAKEYLNSLGKITKDFSFLVKTNNIYLDILLRSKLGMAEQMGIEVDCNLTIPKVCRVDDIDFCIVFANALDNAIRACSPRENERNYILIRGDLQGDFYMVEIQNSCADIEKIEEGIGLSNIKAVLDQYHGAMTFEQKDHYFCLNLLFNLSQHTGSIR